MHVHDLADADLEHVAAGKDLRAAALNTLATWNAVGHNANRRLDQLGQLLPPGA